MSAVIELHPLAAIDEVKPGDDLARLLAQAIRAAGLLPEPNDVLVVTQKIVSKAEGRFADLASVTPSSRAIELAAITRKDARFVELVLAESAAILRAAPNVLITRHRSGHVMANAGIDRSNRGPGVSDQVLLLPIDADASAGRLREALRRYWQRPPAVLISDSFGRPWRTGVTNVAIGASGLPVLIDRRGETDRDGRKLEVTQVAFGDLIAAASGLVSGEAAEGIPAVLLCGWRWQAPERPASALLRPLEEDLFQ
jgi:coenzyme F420-0:L-glutamate ligase/coenzyme F420-1:gamma-L-glutamate ligase